MQMAKWVHIFKHFAEGDYNYFLLLYFSIGK